VLVQDAQVQLVRPPVAVRRSAAGSVDTVRYWALFLFAHNDSFQPGDVSASAVSKKYYCVVSSKLQMETSTSAEPRK
jgi:hypothetical protein